eukprot:gene23716-9267_t
MEQLTSCSDLPDCVITDILLRAVASGTAVCDLSSVCRSWASIISANIADVLTGGDGSSLIEWFDKALLHGKGDAARKLVCKFDAVEQAEHALIREADWAVSVVTSPMISILEAERGCVRGEMGLLSVEHDESDDFPTGRGEWAMSVVRSLIDFPIMEAELGCVSSDESD